MKARNTLLSIVAAALMAVGMCSCGAYTETYYGPGTYVSASTYYPYYYPGYVPPMPPRPIIVNKPSKPGPGLGPSINPTPGQKPPVSSTAPSKPNTPSMPTTPAAPSASQRPGANVTTNPSVTKPITPAGSSVRPGSGASAVRPGAIKTNN